MEDIQFSWLVTRNERRDVISGSNMYYMLYTIHGTVSTRDI